MKLELFNYYVAQLKAIAPYIHCGQLADDIGVNRSTLWRTFKVIGTSKRVNLEIIQKLIEVGILKEPLIVLREEDLPQGDFSNKYFTRWE